MCLYNINKTRRGSKHNYAYLYSLNFVLDIFVQSNHYYALFTCLVQSNYHYTFKLFLTNQIAIRVFHCL